MITPLISTKYHLPPAAQYRVHHSRLLIRPDELLAPGKRLALVSALAGSGKTTLVRSWVEQYCSGGDRTSPIRVAWLSLDEEDNDLATFLAYLVASLKAACPEIDVESTVEVETGSPYANPPARPVLARLVNQLAEAPGKIVWVFDDYHTLSAPTIHEAITFLLDHLPDGARLVIITRAESLLPVSRLRPRGIKILKTKDLGFYSLGNLPLRNPENSGHWLDVIGLPLGAVKWDY